MSKLWYSKPLSWRAWALISKNTVKANNEKSDRTRRRTEGSYIFTLFPPGCTVWLLIIVFSPSKMSQPGTDQLPSFFGCLTSSISTNETYHVYKLGVRRDVLFLIQEDGEFQQLLSRTRRDSRDHSSVKDCQFSASRLCNNCIGSLPFASFIEPIMYVMQP